MLLTDPETAADIRPLRAHCTVAVLSSARYAGLVVVLGGTPEAGNLPADLATTVLVHRPSTAPPWAA